MEMNTISTTFHKVHRGVVLSHLFVGYSAPTYRFQYKSSEAYLKVYVFLLNTISIFCTVAFLGGIFFTPGLSFESICRAGVCTSTLVFVSVVGILMITKHDDFNDITDRASHIFDRCMNDPLDPNKSFKTTFYSNFKPLYIYTAYSTPFCVFVGIMYIMPSYIKSFKSLGFSGDPDLIFPLWIPFEYKESPYLEIAVVIEIFGICVAACRKMATECLLMAYLHSEITFLRHLKHTLPNVFNDATYTFPLKDNVFHVKALESVRCELSSQEVKLKHWAILHQDVVKLGGRITQMYSMILASYMVSITVIITLAAFTAMQRKPGEGGQFIQDFGVIFYYICTMFSFYLLCHFGSLVTHESQTVAELVDHGYFSNKKISNSMKIIMQRIQSPIRICAFRSPNFDVSKETFLTFVKSTVSFYLALLQFGERFQN